MFLCYYFNSLIYKSINIWNLSEDAINIKNEKGNEDEETESEEDEEEESAEESDTEDNPSDDDKDADSCACPKPVKAEEKMVSFITIHHMMLNQFKKNMNY